MKNLNKFVVGFGAAAAVNAASAATSGPDFTQLTGAIDMSTTSAAVLAVAALVIGVTLAVSGAKVIIRMVKGI
ncbi:hypothetical protein PQR11_15110 [Paraburkholderia strydomiana]|uniref:hypothetical protein n=1 Tax=Paraburkholderia strydomiana TaxID=1245417 RepID=UPI000D8F035F